MQLFVDHTYKIQFVSEVPEGHPDKPQDGYYTLLQHLGYSEIQAVGINNYPRKHYENKTFYKLRDVESRNIHYVPETYMLGHPVIEVREYPRLMLGVDLGIINNPDVLTQLREDITSMLQEYHYAAFYISWEFAPGAAEYTLESSASAGTDSLSLAEGTENIDVGMAVDNRIEGIRMGTTVEEVISVTEIKLSRDLSKDISATETVRIDNAVNEQPLFTSDDTRFVAIDKSWLTEEEALDNSVYIESTSPTPRQERARLRRENARLKAQVRVLDELAIKPLTEG